MRGNLSQRLLFIQNERLLFAPSGLRFHCFLQHDIDWRAVYRISPVCAEHCENFIRENVQDCCSSRQLLVVPVRANHFGKYP